MRRSDSGISQTVHDHRLREVAEILAAAIVRLRLRAALPDGFPGSAKSLNSSVNCLEVVGETRLSVEHVG